MGLKTTCSKASILRSLATGGTLWPEAAGFSAVPEWVDGKCERAPRVLLVVAHPDDESECAAVLYRITHELGGTVDQAIVTNGEAGFQHSALAQSYYRLPLTREGVGRKHLPKIRRQEVLRANQILGIRHTYFFDQKDTGYTLDPREGLRAWDVEKVRGGLIELMQREDYDLLLTLLPAADSHGHHQTVAILVLQAVAEFAPERRPAVLGVKTAASDEDLPDRFDGVADFPLTHPSTREPVWKFDRRTPMLGQSALDYSIVANWVIAEHKSQGMFQMEFGRKRFECFWLFGMGGMIGRSRWDRFRELADRLSPQEYVIQQPHEPHYAPAGS
jgi:LmbE family N-acetylglucosaminyl deacetylase